ncbi:lysostaphin resistance A-like protein [Arenimonas alkanexedens]
MLPLRAAALDLLVYFGATIALTLVLAAPLVVQYQRAQEYGPQRVQLTFQPCQAERWNETAVKDVLFRQGELLPSHAPDGRTIPKFMNVWMLPHEAEGAHEPGVLGYFELHPHTGQRPHIDGPALVNAAGCPITEIRVSPLASLADGMQSLPERLARPMIVIALGAAGLAALLAWWLRARQLPSLPAPMPLGRAMAMAVVAGLLLQLSAMGLLWALRGAGLNLEPSNLAPVVSLLREQPALAFLMVALVAPLGEELFFRHLLLRRFAVLGRPIAGLALSAAVFGILHEISPGGGSGLAQLAMTGIYVAMGLVFGAVYLRTRRFLAVALAHVVTNAIALFALAYSAS